MNFVFFLYCYCAGINIQYYTVCLTSVFFSLCIHKIGNPGTDVAISMHLYSPPFRKCKIWMDPSDCSMSSIASMYNFSEYGSRNVSTRM